MKKIINPLFPNSQETGVRGAYEYAALLDDEKQTYGEKDRIILDQPSVKPTASLKSYRQFSNGRKQIMRAFKEQRNELRGRLRNREITVEEYRRLYKQLAKDTDSKVWGNCFSYWNGTSKTARKTAKQVRTQPQREVVTNLDKIEF